MLPVAPAGVRPGYRDAGHSLSETYVKNLKLVILLCGLVGLAELILPIGGGSLLKLTFEAAAIQGVVMLAVFALPTVMALIALIKPPMQPWQAGVALSGFAIGIVKFQVWTWLPHLGELDLHGIIKLVVLVVGALASILAVLRPDEG